MASVAEHLVHQLEGAGVRHIYGIVGDSLNPVVDAVRRSKKIRWIHVRHARKLPLSQLLLKPKLPASSLSVPAPVAPETSTLLMVSTMLTDPTCRFSSSRPIFPPPRLVLGSSKRLTPIASSTNALCSRR